jgi:hypothetical protein
MVLSMENNQLDGLKFTIKSFLSASKIGINEKSFAKA